MLRWSLDKQANVEAPQIDNFLADVLAVCQKHGLWISHEDTDGSFMIVNIDLGHWLRAAVDARIPDCDCRTCGHKASVHVGDRGQCATPACDCGPGGWS